MAKIIKKDGFILDSPVYSNDYHICQESGTAYTCTLNQTDLRANNNKYYILQLLENDSNNNDFVIFTRWGRLGNKGTTKVLKYSSSLPAIREFEKTFKSKTGNFWSNRNNFQKKSGKYYMSQIDYGEDKEEE